VKIWTIDSMQQESESERIETNDDVLKYWIVGKKMEKCYAKVTFSFCSMLLGTNLVSNQILLL
jgi:hypothetical protein